VDYGTERCEICTGGSDHDDGKFDGSSGSSGRSGRVQGARVLGCRGSLRSVAVGCWLLVNNTVMADGRWSMAAQLRSTVDGNNSRHSGHFTMDKQAFN
jgi:hypothetical protein